MQPLGVTTDIICALTCSSSRSGGSSGGSSSGSSARGRWHISRPLIGIARAAALEQMVEIVNRVLDAALIDDRAERLAAIAEVCVRYDLERQHRH